MEPSRGVEPQHPSFAGKAPDPLARTWNRWRGSNPHPAGPDARSGAYLADNGMVGAVGIEPTLDCCVRTVSTPVERRASGAC